jgi:hypothetical protein
VAKVALQTDETCYLAHLHVHKSECQQPYYVLRIELEPQYFLDPRVYRILSCPSRASFLALHAAIAIAFGWTDTASGSPGWEFVVYQKDGSVRERIQATKRNEQGIETLASNTTLYSVLENPRNPIHQVEGKGFMGYEYHFCPGEDWHHSIFFLRRELLDFSTGSGIFHCIKGEGRGCAEGVGGPQDWVRLLGAYDEGERNMEQRAIIEWYEGPGMNKENSWGLLGSFRLMWDNAKVNAVLPELYLHPRLDNELLERNRSILLISLDPQASFNRKYRKVVAQLLSRTTRVREVTTMASAMFQLSRGHVYRAVIVTDPAIFNIYFDPLHRRLVEYVRSSVQDTAVIFGFRCGSVVDSSVVRLMNDAFINIWELNWAVAIASSIHFL